LPASGVPSLFGQLAVKAVIGPLVSLVKTLEHAWRQIRQILGQEVRSERRGRCARVAISPLPRGQERNHALREKPESDAAQNIARTGSAEGDRRICV